MKKEEKVFYHNYLCFYCRHEFKARSGKEAFNDNGVIMLKNGIVCPQCKAMLPNKI